MHKIRILHNQAYTCYSSLCILYLVNFYLTAKNQPLINSRYNIYHEE